MVSSSARSDLLQRKAEFESAWKALRRDRGNPTKALQAVHSAFQADCHELVSDYLSSPALIDVSSLLFSWYRKRETFDTVRRWSDFLITRFHQKEAIQLLEVALSTGACK